jgi:hypothetical protein
MAGPRVGEGLILRKSKTATDSFEIPNRTEIIGTSPYLKDLRRKKEVDATIKRPQGLCQKSKIYVRTYLALIAGMIYGLSDHIENILYVQRKNAQWSSISFLLVFY